MLELNFEPPEEINLPDGRTALVVGLSIDEVTLGIKFTAINDEIEKLQPPKPEDEGKGKRTPKKKTQKQQEEDEKKLKELVKEKSKLMKELLKLGLIDKKTREPIEFPREYRNIYNDQILIEAIMKATERGAPIADPLPQNHQNKSSEK